MHRKRKRKRRERLMSDMAGSRVLDELLRQARPEQREAVTAVEPLVVVGAGAGTGKTKTLAWRFLWALLAFPETRVENILTLTFTEKAAREMRERIGKMLSAARETAESLGLGDAHGATPTVVSPSVSSSPKARLRHCTAAPAVPFARLSMAPIATTRPAASSTATCRWAVFAPATALVCGHSPSGTRWMNGSASYAAW